LSEVTRRLLDRALLGLFPGRSVGARETRAGIGVIDRRVIHVAEPLLSPYNTIVVLLSMPLRPSSSSSFFIGTMSRTSVSQSSVVQFQPAAPGTCPCS
jgi:hypothetical protein